MDRDQTDKKISMLPDSLFSAWASDAVGKKVWGWSQGNEPSDRDRSQESGVQKAVRVSVGSCLWGAGNGAGLRGKEAKLLCCPGKVLEGSVKILEPGHMFRIVPLRGWGPHLLQSMGSLRVGHD